MPNSRRPSPLVFWSTNVDGDSMLPECRDSPFNRAALGAGVVLECRKSVNLLSRAFPIRAHMVPVVVALDADECL